MAGRDSKSVSRQDAKRVKTRRKTSSSEEAGNKIGGGTGEVSGAGRLRFSLPGDGGGLHGELQDPVRENAEHESSERGEQQRQAGPGRQGLGGFRGFAGLVHVHH